MIRLPVFDCRSLFTLYLYLTKQWNGELGELKTQRSVNLHLTTTTLTTLSSIVHVPLDVHVLLNTK